MKSIEFLKAIALSGFLLLALQAGARESRSVTSVATAVTLSGEVDYHITAKAAITSGGSLNIEGEEAWLFFDNVVPSAVIKYYLPKITVNGSAAVIDQNIMVTVYKQGAVVIPHGTNYNPLTVYTGPNYTGNSKGDFAVFTYYQSLGTFNNAIQSFKLKRGYMATLANDAGGTGYSRCFIADDADIEMPVMPGELNAKVSFIRIFRWRYPSKKGFAGGDQTALDTLNCTWFCDWNIDGNTSQYDYDYALHRHHIGWPSYSGINGKNNVEHLLGDNEPDNTGDSKENDHTVDEVLAQWEGMYGSGLRVGSPACTSANSSWLYPFVDSCDARGYRLDFVALHCYWYMDASSWRSSLQSIYNRVKRPLWITEWNYGANWTGWPGTSADNPTDADYQIHLAKIKAIVAVLDELPFVERYAFYNWVQEARKFYKDGYILTPSGQYYASTTPPYFFNRSYEVIPKAVYKNPGTLTSTFTPAYSTARLSWTDPNREMSDSTQIERQMNDGGYQVVGSVRNSSLTNYAFVDTIKAGAGNYTYRLRVYLASGVQKLSNETYVNISGTQGLAQFQYGQLQASSTEYSYNYFGTPFDEAPAVIFGPASNNNTTLSLVPHIYQIKTNYFQFRYYPWIMSDGGSFTNTETSSYMAVKKGNGAFGDMTYECATIPTKVGNDTLQVTFNQPFAAGVTPLVFAGVYTTHTSHPFMWKIWDVTNTGFKIKLVREAGITASTFLKEYVNYFAVTPGSASMGNGKRISAGRSDIAVGRILRVVKFGGYHLPNAYLFAEPQTASDDLASILRYSLLNDSCVRIRRQVDASATGTARNDTIGWMTISDDPDAVSSPQTDTQASPLELSNNASTLWAMSQTATWVTLYSVTGIQIATAPFDMGVATLNIAALPAGIYIVRTDKGGNRLFVKR